MDTIGNQKLPSNAKGRLKSVKDLKLQNTVFHQDKKI